MLFSSESETFPQGDAEPMRKRTTQKALSAYQSITEASVAQNRKETIRWYLIETFCGEVWIDRQAGHLDFCRHFTDQYLFFHHGGNDFFGFVRRFAADAVVQIAAGDGCIHPHLRRLRSV